MNRRQKHVTTLITITLLLLVVLVGIAVVKGTFDIQAWVMPTKKVKVTKITMSTQTTDTLQEVLDLVARDSEYSFNKQEIDTTDDFIDQLEAGKTEVYDPNTWTTKETVIASVDRMIHITSNLASAYYKAFGIIGPNGESPPARYMPRGEDGMEVPGGYVGQGADRHFEYVYFLVDDINELMDIKDDLEENFPEDISFVEDLRDVIDGFVTVGNDILELSKEIQHQIAVKCKATAKEDDPICAVEVLPFPPETELLVKEAIRIRNLIGGGIQEWKKTEIMLFVGMLELYLEIEDEEGLTNRQKLMEEWTAFTEGDIPEETMYYYVLNFLNLLALMLDADDPLRDDLFELYQDLLYISGYLNRLQKDVEEIVVPLSPLLDYMTVPYQYHVLGAVGQIEISYIYPTLDPMSQLNSAVINALRPFEDNRTIGSYVTSVINYVENINSLIGGVEDSIGSLTPRVNTYVTVVKEEVGRDYYQELMEVLAAFEERVKKAIGDRLGEREAEGEAAMAQEAPPAEEPIACKDAVTPNEVVKACEDYASKIVAQDIKSMTSDYLRIWTQYVAAARAVRSMLNRVRR